MLSNMFLTVYNLYPFLQHQLMATLHPIFPNGFRIVTGEIVSFQGDKVKALLLIEQERRDRTASRTDDQPMSSLGRCPLRGDKA